VYSH
jgi:hypothetical protein